MLGHTPQCSGVSTQVLAECTPALAGEGRKNQSLLVPNVLERAEERRSTLEGVSESRTGRGETEASGSPHRLAKGKQRSTPAWTWVRRAPARRSRPTRSAGTSRLGIGQCPQTPIRQGPKKKPFAKFQKEICAAQTPRWGSVGVSVFFAQCCASF